MKSQIQKFVDKHVLQISPQARDDFDDILLDTESRWGREQASQYETSIDRTMVNLVDHPEMGRECPELLVGGRRIQTGRHVIYYSIQDDVITIQRILHERQMPTVRTFETRSK